MRPEFLIGVDLGQSIDYSTVAVAEIVHVLSGEHEPVPGAIAQTRSGQVIPVTREKISKRLDIRHLMRFERGRPYPEMVGDITDLVGREPLRSGNSTLIVDRSGVGRPIGDLFELADLPCELAMVTITGGDHEIRDGNNWTVPKRTLIAATQVMLQQGRLRIADGLPLAATLARELVDYQVRISASGHDSYSAPSGAHDDLLMALSLIAWFGGDEGETRYF